MVLHGPLSPQTSLFQEEPSSLLPKTADREGTGVGDFSLSCLSGSSNVVLSWGCSWADMTLSYCCALQERAESITTFALCGFANLSSIGITLGGLCECD